MLEQFANPDNDIKFTQNQFYNLKPTQLPVWYG